MAATLKEIALSEDGETVFIRFTMPDHTTTEIELASFYLPTIIADLAGVSAVARSRSTLSSHGVVATSTPARYKAELSEDRSAVLVGFQMQNGLEHRFAFPPNHAENLARQIAESAKQGIRGPSRKN